MSILRKLWPALMLLFLAACTQEEAGRPNFVWIISEDNSKHYMALFDEHGIKTPNIEALAEEGITFQRAFSNGAVCSVARSTLISGCYAPRTGAQYHRKLELVPMPDGVEMFPSYLRKAGYYTTNRSKEDYNFIKPDGVWDESSGKAHWRNREGDQPFFHKASYGISHEGQLHFDPSLADSYEPASDPDEVFVFPNHPDTELFRFTGALYRDRILSVDSIVGRVMAELEEDGLLENTFIFYFGDHGGVLPGSKGYIYESGIHVPLVVRIPENFRHLVDFKAGSQSNGFVSFVDFGPTLLELAGAGLPQGIDGRPFLGEGIPAGEVEKWDVSYAYADRFDEKYDMVRTVRKGRYKYMRSYQPFNIDGLQNNYRYQCAAFTQWRDMYHAGELNEQQAAFFEARPAEALYDLEEDPFEGRNLAGDPAYAETLADMRGLLSNWVKGMPDLSFYPESRLIKEAFGNPVSYGQAHRDEIAALVDIADLSLLPFDAAGEELSALLTSEDDMKLYWALISASSFGEEAAGLAPLVVPQLGHENLLVRTRAAEFMGLAGLADPVPHMLEALRLSEDPVEALLILNSLVLMVDGPAGYSLDGSALVLNEEVSADTQVERRLSYLHGKYD